MMGDMAQLVSDDIGGDVFVREIGVMQERKVIIVVLREHSGVAFSFFFGRADGQDCYFQEFYGKENEVHDDPCKVDNAQNLPKIDRWICWTGDIAYRYLINRGCAIGSDGDFVQQEDVGEPLWLESVSNAGIEIEQGT